MATKRKADSEVGEETMDKDETLTLRNKFIAKSCKLFFKSDPLKITSAKGQYMYDERGNRYLDCINNVAHVGHCHPDVVKAGCAQMSVLNTNVRFLHDNIVLLAKNLASILPGNLSVCYFVNSGSEANDLALRLARAHTKARDMLVLEHAYHGTTISVTDISPYKFNGKMETADWVHVVNVPDTYRGIYNDKNCPGQDLTKLYVDQLQGQIDALKKDGRKLCGYIAESLQSCGGQILPPRGYMKKVYKSVRDAGGVCIADEVQVGFGRIGSKWWGFELHDDDVVPDIVTVGKPMGNGHPVAAVITTPAIADSFINSGMEYFNTYGGNPVSCAVALSVLSTIKNERLRENAQQVGSHILTKLKDLQKKHPLIGDVRGVGFFIGVELVKNRETRDPATAEAQHIIYRLKEQCVLMSADGPDRNVLKFKSPMCFNKENANELLGKLDEVLTEIESPEGVNRSNTSDTNKNEKVGNSDLQRNSNGPVKKIRVN